MALTFKLGSLAIRTLAKPLANYIKHNAREHDRFRSLCVSFAQSLHRVDMRLRLGLLQDPAAIERQVQRELADNARRAKQAAAASSKAGEAGGGGSSSSSSSNSSGGGTGGAAAGSKVHTVKTEQETKIETDKLKREKEKLEEKARKLPKVRPLSEAKAIETGANFISEAFLFSVAVGLIGLEYWRSRRKETNRRDDVAERLEDLESENSELKAQIIRIESALEHDGVKLGSTSEWLALAKKNLVDDSSKSKPQYTKSESTSEPATSASKQSVASPNAGTSAQAR